MKPVQAIKQLTDSPYCTAVVVSFASQVTRLCLSTLATIYVPDLEPCMEGKIHLMCL